jgi:exopolysaccharide biosynthesis predicted pyruvyltransferase EpsI
MNRFDAALVDGALPDMALSRSEARYLLAEVMGEIGQLNTLLHLGCGNGALLAAAEDLGVGDRTGFDGPWAGSPSPARRILPRLDGDGLRYVMRGLSQPLDLAVARLPPAGPPDGLLAVLCDLADAILLLGAPGAGTAAALASRQFLVVPLATGLFPWGDAPLLAIRQHGTAAAVRQRDRMPEEAAPAPGLRLFGQAITVQPPKQQTAAMPGRPRALPAYASAGTLAPLRVEMEAFLRDFAGQRILYLPNPGNGGDSLIAAATFAAFRRAGIDYRVIGPYAEVQGETVFLGGGGNFIPLYQDIRNAFTRVLGRARRIVLLPHTIRGNEELLTRLDESCTLFCRDVESLHWLRLLRLRAEARLAHDMAFHLDPAAFMNDPAVIRAAHPTFRRLLAASRLDEAAIRARPVMNYSRLDKEARDASPRSDIDVSHAFMIGVGPGIASVASWGFLRTVQLARAVRTDRLHIGIACALLGVPCELRDNSYGKNASIWRHSLAGRFPKLRFVEG